MKITIRNIDEPIEFSEEYVSTLEVQNKYLLKSMSMRLLTLMMEWYFLID